ncbi:MAG: hypothetical protein U0525_05885 [Patescibacteria group bacterium]
MARIPGNPEYCGACALVNIRNIGTERTNDSSSASSQPPSRKDGDVEYWDRPHCLSAQIAGCQGPVRIDEVSGNLICNQYGCISNTLNV